MFHLLLKDTRYAIRSLRRTPGMVAAAVTTLALGLGANVALFTVVNGVLLRPLPYPDADRIVTIRHHAPGLNIRELHSSPGLIDLYRERARTLGRLAGYENRERNQKMAELDRLLDKVSEKGIDALSKADRAALERLSKEIR